MKILERNNISKEQKLAANGLYLSSLKSKSEGVLEYSCGEEHVKQSFYSEYEFIK